MASFGGSKPEVKVKSIGDLTQEAAQANISTLPMIIEAMNKYGPQYAAALMNANAGGNPTIKPLAELLTGRLEELGSGNLPSYLRTPFLANLRAGQAARGMAESPISAVSEATALGGLTEESLMNTIGSALEFGRNPGMSVDASDLGLGLPGIGGLTGLAQEQNVSEINQAADANSRRVSKNKMLGSIIGGVGGAMIGMPDAGAAAGGAIGGTFF